MKSKTTKRFRARVKALPEPTRKQAQEAYRVFRENPYHPSLHFKLVIRAEQVYSVRIGLHYRALGRWIGDEIVWFWIGSHADYDRLIG